MARSYFSEWRERDIGAFLSTGQWGTVLNMKQLKVTQKPAQHCWVKSNFWMAPLRRLKLAIFKGELEAVCHRLFMSHRTHPVPPELNLPVVAIGPSKAWQTSCFVQHLTGDDEYSWMGHKLCKAGAKAQVCCLWSHRCGRFLKLNKNKGSGVLVGTYLYALGKEGSALFTCSSLLKALWRSKAKGNCG